MMQRLRHRRQNKMNMKKLIETVESCGSMPTTPQQDQGNPVRMSVNLSASGKDHVDDLVNMMKNAGNRKTVCTLTNDASPPRIAATTKRKEDALPLSRSDQKAAAA